VHTIEGSGATVEEGASCDFTMAPADGDENCRVTLRCAGKRVYDAKKTCSTEQGVAQGLEDGAPSPIDGDGTLSMGETGREIVIGDSTAKGVWTAKVALSEK
jgi:hypothetical protein